MKTIKVNENTYICKIIRHCLGKGKAAAISNGAITLKWWDEGQSLIRKFLKNLKHLVFLRYVKKCVSFCFYCFMHGGYIFSSVSYEDFNERIYVTGQKIS